MTTPTQAKLTIETPFGTATIHDSRYYADHKESRPRLAGIYFEGALTVNRKEYQGVHLSVERWHDGEVYVGPNGYGYRDLTESARNKLRDWFNLPENLEILKPYLEPLDPADIRRQIKSSLHSNIASELHKQEGETNFPPAARESGLVKELMIETLRDALAWVESGKSFSSFYFDGNK
jgi:hypothetical protein